MVGDQQNFSRSRDLHLHLTLICQYAGTMNKATFRLPGPLLEELRQRSRQEGRSINAVAIDALRLGLGSGVTNPDLHEILGPLVVKPATGVYTAGDVERALAGVSDPARDLWKPFEWTRGER